MSKDTPEVGDVWQFKYEEFETKYYVSAIARNPSPVYYYFILYKNGNNEVVGCWWDKEMLTYLYKSKANINDLFKTENEE